MPSSPLTTVSQLFKTSRNGPWWLRYNCILHSLRDKKWAPQPPPPPPTSDVSPQAWYLVRAKKRRTFHLFQADKKVFLPHPCPVYPAEHLLPRSYSTFNINFKYLLQHFKYLHPNVIPNNRETNWKSRLLLRIADQTVDQQFICSVHNLD